MVSSTKTIDLTPQESEQLSKYVSDDAYVQRQKEDITELTEIFREMMYKKGPGDGEEYINDFINHFKPQAGFRALYKINIEERKKPLYIEVSGAHCECNYNERTGERVEVEMTISHDTMEEIILGHMTFQRAFMTSKMKMKGDFKTLRNLDLLFDFAKPAGEQ
jgi:putative sterol carrier protein